MTQNERVLEHLKEKGGITHLEAMHEYGICRLASRIADLREKGVKIKREMVRGKNRHGEATRFAKYELMEE